MNEISSGLPVIIAVPGVPNAAPATAEQPEMAFAQVLDQQAAPQPFVPVAAPEPELPEAETPDEKPATEDQPPLMFDPSMFPLLAGILPAIPEPLPPLAEMPSEPAAETTAPIFLPVVKGQVLRVPIPQIPEKPAAVSPATPLPQPTAKTKTTTPNTVEGSEMLATTAVGTATAKETVVMTHLRTPAAAVEVPAPSVEVAPHRALPVSPAPQFSSGEHSSGDNPTFQDPTTPTSATSEPDQPAPSFVEVRPLENLQQATPGPEVKVAREVAVVADHVREAISTMRADARGNVEVRVPLENGQEVTVRLRMHGGEVRAVFENAPAELRQALEQHWTQFSSAVTDRTVRITTPVFETPQTPTGQNNFEGESQERQRHFEETPREPAAFRPRSTTVSARHFQPATLVPQAITSGLQVWA